MDRAIGTLRRHLAETGLRDDTLLFYCGDHKLIVLEPKDRTPAIELFDLKSDPAEKHNLLDRQPELARTLQSKRRQWQDSALKSLTGADYRLEDTIR